MTGAWCWKWWRWWREPGAGILEIERRSCWRSTAGGVFSGSISGGAVGDQPELRRVDRMLMALQKKSVAVVAPKKAAARAAKEESDKSKSEINDEDDDQGSDEIRWSGRWRRKLGMAAEQRTSAGEDARVRAWSSWRHRGCGRQLGTRRAVQSAGSLRQPAERRHRALEPAGVRGYGGAPQVVGVLGPSLKCRPGWPHGGWVSGQPGPACVHSISSRSSLKRICML